MDAVDPLIEDTRVEAGSAAAEQDADFIEPSDEERASIRALRLKKVADLRASGGEPYPYRFDRDRTIDDLRSEFGSLEAGEEREVEVSLAGRLMLKRDQGRLTFGQLRDRSGEIQLFVSAGVIGKERLAEFTDLLGAAGHWQDLCGAAVGG